MKNIKLTFGYMAFIIFIPISACSQSDYYLKVSEAHGYYYTREYLQALELFQEAFLISDPKDRDLIIAAFTAAELGRKEQALAYLRKYFDINAKIYLDIHALTSYPALKALKSDPGWDPVLKKALRNNALIEAKLDNPLRNSLDSLYQLDQQTRDMSIIDSLIALHGFPSEPVSEYFKKMNKQDENNLKRFKELVPVGTWPGISRVGTKANLTAWLIIQHNSTEIQKQYLPTLKESAEAGDSKWEHVAGTIDRIMEEETGTQLYGTQFGMDENGNGFVKPIQDPEHVDKRRERVGLIMLEHDVKRHGIKLE